MEKVDVVIIGAGLAGLSAAYHLAAAGIETIVVERGDFPGAKNVTGGRLYLNPVRPYFPPDFWNDAPFERAVVKERLSMLAARASTTVEFCSEKFREAPRPSYTLLRAKFDQWLADKARDAGALIIPKNQVDDLIFDGARVVGVKSTEAELLCDVVVAADGVLSFIAEKAKMRGVPDPHHYAVGVKEIVELPAKTIEDRFGVGAGEGAAQLFFGALTQGMLGGGFLYTNQESISLGMVVGIRSLMEQGRATPSGRPARIEAPELTELLKARPEIAPLVAGGNTVEYSAHVIPEGGVRAMPKLVGDGIVLAGDAAGFALNMAVTVRGMDFALASGALAARAIKDAKAQGDFSAASLGAYEQMLRDSFVLQDLQTFRSMLDVLDNPRMFTKYPEAIARIFEQLFSIDAKAKDKLSATVMREAARHFGNLDVVRDAAGMLKV
jgi:electron transfer flavoprotein-quinone oxidoreductase